MSKSPKKSREVIDKDFDALLDSMQEPDAGKGFDAMLKATPKELGKASHNYAKRKDKGAKG